MATYDFGLLTVLVVEDNSYMRSMQRMLLRALGVGNVVVAGDGGAAIEFLRKVKLDPAAAGVSTIDMIMSNWQMEPVDGAMLLKWVRRHKESPDRFIPFIMVSGYGDFGRVAEARDLGATEFMAKPYSVQKLLMRLMAVVAGQRQFVLLDTYFGPDRRRRPAAPPSAERRVMKEKDIEIIHDDT